MRLAFLNGFGKARLEQSATSCLKPAVSTFARLLAMTSSRWAWAAAPSAEMYIPYGMTRTISQVRPPASAAL